MMCMLNVKQRRTARRPTRLPCQCHHAVPLATLRVTMHDDMGGPPWEKVHLGKEGGFLVHTVAWRRTPNHNKRLPLPCPPPDARDKRGRVRCGGKWWRTSSPYSRGS